MDTLLNCKLRLTEQLDCAVEKARGSTCTGGVFQAIVYQEKYEEAVDYMAARYPTNLRNYPFIQAESEATNTQPKNVAQNILNVRGLWIARLAKIESIRFKAKAAINQATSVDELKLIHKDVIQQLDCVE